MKGMKTAGMAEEIEKRRNVKTVNMKNGYYMKGYRGERVKL